MIHNSFIQDTLEASLPLAFKQYNRLLHNSQDMFPRKYHLFGFCLSTKDRVSLNLEPVGTSYEFLLISVCPIQSNTELLIAFTIWFIEGLILVILPPWHSMFDMDRCAFTGYTTVTIYSLNKSTIKLTYMKPLNITLVNFVLKMCHQNWIPT